jgi:quinol monooxygenase YgiN
VTIQVQISATVDQAKLTDLMPFLEANLPNVRGFDGCLRVSVMLNEETGAMVLDEEWLSIEHHQKYLAFIEANGVLGQLAAHFDGRPDIRYYDRVPI